MVGNENQFVVVGSIITIIGIEKKGYCLISLLILVVCYYIKIKYFVV